MPSRVVKSYRTGSKNWRAFLDGQIDAQTLFEKEYFGPIAVEVEQALKESGIYTQKLLEGTTKGWSNPPTFVVNARGQVRDLKRARAELVFLATGAGAEKWNWVDQGTPAHDIPAANRKPIRPMPIRPYKPRTQPGTGVPRPRGSGTYLPPERFANRVHHPGIRPRNFSERIAEHMTHHPKLGFRARIEAAIVKVRKRLKIR